MSADGALGAATAEQPRAQAALTAALRSGPAHAYAFVGPSGSGKVAAARAFAAELLADGASDPRRARARAAADPPTHPDLSWLRPPGNQHLVDDIRREVIAAIALRPFEGRHRVFVIEAADAMAEESQNGLLKTLEEPPDYAFLILITSEPAALLETVRSRCQQVQFTPLSPDSLAERIAAEHPGTAPETVSALANLAGGDLGRARALAAPQGERLRAQVERAAGAALAGDLAGRPWSALLEVAAERGKELAQTVSDAAAERAEQLGKGREATRVRSDGEKAAKRAERRARTETIDAALALLASWFVDLAALGEGAPELVSAVDRREQLAADARAIDSSGARRAAELTMAMRRRLTVNVNEDLALDALFHGISRFANAETAS